MKIQITVFLDAPYSLVHSYRCSVGKRIFQKDQHLCTKLMVSHPHDCNHETKPMIYVIMTYKTKERYQYILYNASYSRCTKTEFIIKQNSGTAQYTHAKIQLAGTCVAAAHASGFHEISQDTHNATGITCSLCAKL
jgi:hypothetical protein